LSVIRELDLDAVDEGQFNTLVIPSQLYRRAICFVPAPKQQIPRANYRASE
jgi:hypothetical protein